MQLKRKRTESYDPFLRPTMSRGDCRVLAGKSCTWPTLVRDNRDCYILYSAPIHWLIHGHMTSNNENISPQILLAGNTAKTMTSNGKEFTVTREMLNAVARDQR